MDQDAIRQIRQYFEVMRRALNRLEEMIGELTNGQPLPVDVPLKPIPDAIPLALPPLALPPVSMERKQHITKLMEIDCWPLAVPAHLTVTPTDEDLINRANSVLDALILTPVEGTHFLDIGCGDGWITKEASYRGFATTTGYDIVQHSNWEQIKGVTFTTDIHELKEHYYDTIMIYDVLDHCKDPVGLMSNVKKLLRLGGTIFVRCHPWTSRHAMHLHRQGLNKAYIHLFLQWQETYDLLQKEPMFTRIEIDPMQAYHWWFDGFKVVRERVIPDEPLSDFFKVEAFKNLIIEEHKKSTPIPPKHIEGFFKCLEMQFVDFILSN